jgi:hypothetical protein
MLHAERLAAPHPLGGKFTVFAGMPADFQAVVSTAGLDLAKPTDTDY